MTNTRRNVLICALVGLIGINAAWCQSKPLLPSDADLLKARQRAADVFSRVPDNRTAQGQIQAKPVMPRVEQAPKPAIPAPDIAAIAEQYKNLKQPQSVDAKSNDLMVFVSFSMPKAALNRIVDQAEKTGAKLVFRGLKNDSMKIMTGEVRKLIGRRQVGVVIHPPAFQQFTITKVPSVVIAGAEAASVMDDGCAQTGTFVKVSGDVTIEYALEYIERNSASWATHAQTYLAKLKPEILK